MKRWEYTLINANDTTIGGGRFDLTEVSKALNLLGEEGWELVNSFDTNAGQGLSIEYIFILKREVRS